MDTPAPFTDFAIPYSPYWVGSALLLLSIALIVSGILIRSKNGGMARLFMGLGIGFPILFIEWELIVKYMGLDSVLGFFVYSGTALLMGLGLGLWVRRGFSNASAEAAANVPSKAPHEAPQHMPG